MGLDSFPRPPTNRSAAAATGSRSFQPRDRHESYSPPRTPPYQSSKRRHPQQGLGLRSSYPETFLDDITPVDNRRTSESGDEPDPHDLALSPKHVTRTSVVDNMLLSLDQFATGSPLFDDHRFFSSAFDPDNYSGNSRFSMTKRGRVRGHTFSSSVSSDIDPGVEDSTGYHTIHASRTHRSNSSATYQQAPRRYDNLRSRDGPAIRGSGYEGPRTSGPAENFQGRRVHSARQESKSSVSTVDYNQLHERRSASLDYGSRPLFVQDAISRADLLSDDIEAAPTPTVPAGPRRDISNPLGDLSSIAPNIPPRTPALSRRNSNKSAKSTATRKGRSETLGTAALKGREENTPRDLPPPLPSSYVDPSAPSPTISFHKPMLSPGEPAPVKERPGFFRRVFGSSKNSSLSGSDLASTQQLHAGLPGPETDCSTRGGKQPPRPNPPAINQANQETSPPVVAKKASFFRRRKKSVVDHIPPPLNLSAGGLKALDQIQAEPSPVSSLRKVMNPFLADSLAPADDDPKENPDVDDAFKGTSEAEQPLARDYSARPSPRSQLAVEGSAKNGMLRPKHSLNLAIPSHDNDDSFLADSSGNESHRGSSSPFSSERPARPKTSPEAPGHGLVSDADYHQSFVNSKLSVSTQASRSKERASNVAELQSGSLLNADSHKDRLPPKNKAGYSTKGWLDPAASDARVDSSSRVSLPKDNIESPRASNSDVSQYHTASNTPLMETPTISMEESKSQSQRSDSEIAHVVGEAGDDMPTPADREQARRLFENQEEVIANEPAAAWLGNPDRAMIRKAYMEFFNFTNIDILGALRSMCTRLALKGEAQQVDRVLDALSTRWCECNPNHGFKAVDVVHTICYSLLLLNTDLHLADIDQKMTRNQFVRNTMPTIYRVASDAAPDGFETIRPSGKSRIHTKSAETASRSAKSPTLPPSELRLSTGEGDLKKTTRSLTGSSVASPGSDIPGSNAGPLVNTPFHGTIKAWEAQIETVLKDFYNSIQKQRLPLYGSQPDEEALAPPSNNLGNGLRRSPSTLSKSGSDIFPRGRSADSRLTTGRWSSKPRSRARMYPASTMGSSRTSLDDQSSVWSPSASSTWSKYSLGKTLTSLSVDSFGSEYPRGDYQQSIGFANALSHAIIREDSANSIVSFEDSANLVEDETLELAGAPWAKEGSLKHKQHLDSVDKRAKDRNWNECFAVIQRGWLRLFSFNANTRSARLKAKQRQGGGVVVGGGNWMENAEEVWKFLLRQTIASALPPPGYSKSRPHVWALSLPTGAVHLFQVGTAEIVKEFVTTANYWSARLSKEPLIGGISNVEYGWSDAIVNSALVNLDSRSPPSSSGAARLSIQSSIRSSIDQQTVRAKLPADRIHISDWVPPQQSMMASTLSDEDQLKALQNYVKNVEEELQKHNELRQPMVLAFSARHPNGVKAMTNWERKSSYLLREIVKFRTYIDCLRAAKVQKEKIYASRPENDEDDDHAAQVPSTEGQSQTA